MAKPFEHIVPHGFALLVCLALLAACGPVEIDQCKPGEPGCTSTQGCPNGCPQGQYCSAGRCVSDELQCTAAGETCNQAAATSDGFLCVDWDGAGVREAMCSSTCASDASCPLGSRCFVLRSSRDNDCDSDEQCREQMMCVQGTCRYTACQPSECSGFVSGQRACAQKYADDINFPNGANCYEFDNQANYCLPAGTREVGEQCIGIDAALERRGFEETCAEGLGCVAGTCRTPCEGDSDCDGADTCVLGGDTDLGAGVGFCAQPCAPFEENSCGESQTCRPIADGAGHCVPAGQSPAFSRCTPGAGECESGTLCVEYPGMGAEAEARCHPICDYEAGGGTQPERDATCPQSAEPLASVRLVHLSEDLGSVDVYVRGEDAPLVSDLGFEQADPDTADGSGWHELPPGRYDFSVLEAGAPRTDRPLVEVAADLSSGVGRAIYLAPPVPNSSERGQGAAISAPDGDRASATVELRVLHLVSDAAALDVIAVAEGDDAADPVNHVVLAEDVGFGEGGQLVGVPDGELRVLAFAAGAPRTDPATAQFDFDGVLAQADSALALRGTLDPDDFFDARSFTLVPLAEPATDVPDGPTFSCTALEGQRFGYCQQICAGGASDFDADFCQGEAMGCTPTEFARRGEWLTLCAPVGEFEAGDACDPRRPYGRCREGLYCLEYGAGAPAQGGVRGRCTPLCEVDGDASQVLGCEGEQSCRPVVYDGSYGIGQCGYACEPGAKYGDDSCPEGLQSCTPIASLAEDTSGQQTPMVTDEQPYCSPSGPLEAGQSCRGRDCAPGSECLFPRSEQTDLTSTLLSPYFGAAGLEPVCHPQCDPFDGDDAPAECANGQTCLFSYPLSAEVGHCAPIAEDVAPMQPCTKPGLSCGEDSICTIIQGEQLCLRFCDYLGADAQGTLHQSTCPSGLECAPFVNDVGWCQRPE